MLDSGDFDLTGVVEGAAELLGSRAREKTLALTTFVDPAIPPQVRGDAGRLRQVLLNLVGNAVKFTDAGDVSVRVTLEAATENVVTVRFAVRDTGIGLSDVARRRLFQPFMQADGSTTRKYGGTGLGLAICKRLVEMMGGRIGVDSAEGMGSTFWFNACFETSPELEAVLRPPMILRGARILVADPSRMSRDVLRRTLEAAGMRSEEAASGREALDILQEAAMSVPFDLVITESSLHDMEGLQLAHSMRRDPGLIRTPVIMLTATEKRGQGEMAVQTGFAAYMTKPAKRAAILDAIASALEAAAALSEEIRRPLEPEPHEPAQVEPKEEAAARAGTLLLLVEDNVNNQIMAMRQLEKLGCAVHIVSNGLQAVKALAYNPERYALVFMDCQMPEMDGFEASREIRKAEVTSGRHIPIIAMTANAMSGDRERCLAAGMDDYMAKPISRHVLREALDRWLPPAQVANQRTA